MGRIKRTAPSSDYLAANAAGSEMKERADCAVIALSIVTGLDYATVHNALEQAGRVKGHGTYQWQVENALAALGFKLERLPYQWKLDMISTYPGVHKKAQNITTMHPRRFTKQWAGVEPLLIHVAQHYAGFRDGVVHDWTVNKAKRVIDLYRVVKI